MVANVVFHKLGHEGVDGATCGGESLEGVRAWLILIQRSKNAFELADDFLGAVDEGQHESFADTEVDQTAQIGVGGNGRRWSRKFDRAGLVFVSNGISRDHQEYLALGGSGFLLGDGRLNYGCESIVETYYTLHAWRGIYPSFGLQHINNPGYNRDRGPVVEPTLRLHLEF